MSIAGLSPEIEKDLDIAIDYLKSVGCTEIFIFGSVATGEATSESDLDIAVRVLFCVRRIAHKTHAIG